MTEPGTPHPFVKWAGGKRTQAEQIVDLLGDFTGWYFEPFVGGGAVFFSLQPERAVLSDANARLGNCYRQVRDAPEYLAEAVSELEDSRATFNAVRAEMNCNQLDDLDDAAAFLFLNRTGFNGLYRENKSGDFNVAYAEPTGDRLLVDEANLRACSSALEGTAINVGDFEAAFTLAKEGDAIYCDPPYLPIEEASFAAYLAGGFGGVDHMRLRDCAVAAKLRGVRVVLSNSYCPATRALYGEHFELTPVESRRSINSNGGGRGSVKEYLIH